MEPPTDNTQAEWERYWKERNLQEAERISRPRMYECRPLPKPWRWQRVSWDQLAFEGEDYADPDAPPWGLMGEFEREA